MQAIAFENFSKMFLRSILMTSDLLPLATFVKKKKAPEYQFDYISFSKSFEMPLKLKNPLKNEFRKIIKENSLTFSLYKTLKLTVNKSFKRPSFSEMFYLILVFFFSPANILYPLLVLDNILNLFILSVLTELLIKSSF